MRVALYARTSTHDQHVDAQLVALRAYCRGRRWRVRGTFVDDGVSGARAQRPALDRLKRSAARFDVVVAWRLDRLGRSVKHLVLLLDDLAKLEVQVVTVNDAIDLTTPAGRLTMHVLAAVAEMERATIRDRVTAGLAAARTRGVRLGRPRKPITARQLAAVRDLPLSAAAQRLGVSKSLVHKLRKAN